MNSRNVTVVGFSLLALVLSGADVMSAEWDLELGAAPAIEYTDNVCLSRNDKKDEWIGLVTPDMQLEGNGARANLNLRASVELNTLTDSRLEDLGCISSGFGSGRKQFAPDVWGEADAVLIEQWLYVDATLNVYQNQVTPFLPGGGDSLDRTGNTNTTYSYSISPYIQRRFRDSAEVTLRYTYDDQYNTENVVGDNHEQRLNATISDVPGNSKFSWGIQGQYRKVYYSDDRLLDQPAPDGQNESDSTLRSAQLDLGYQLTRSWEVNGFYGDEWNDYDSTNDDIDGTYWDVGLRWTPNTRVTVEGGMGHRFYGNSPRFSIQYRHKRTVLYADYSRNLSYAQDIRSLDQPPPPGEGLTPPPPVDGGLTTLTTSPILDERLTLGYVFQGRRSSFDLSGYQSHQTQESNDYKSEYSGVSASFERDIFSNLSLSVSATWNEAKPESSGNQFEQSSDQWIYGLALERQLGTDTSLSFDYTYTDRQSNNPLNEYRENRFVLSLKMDLL